MKIERVDPGPVHETRAQHAARHPVRHPGCIRCVYDADHTKLETAYGSHQHEQAGDDPGLVRRTVWLAPRPCRLGGDYAVGCMFCADLRQRKEGDASRARARTLGERKFAARARYADSKWARFDQANAEQLAPRGLRQHADTVQHQVAVRAYFAPDVAVTEVEHSGSGVDRELFRGGVPQVEDWLRAWRACRTPQSFHAAEANGITENFIKGSRVPGARRKAFKSMIRVMVFALRSRKLQVLSKAKSCTLLFDDRKDFRIVSYRCCTSEPVESCGSGVQAKKSFVSTGRLAVLRRGGGFSKKTLYDVDEDYSRAMANSIVGGFRRIAESPSTNMVDAAVVDRMRKAVRIAVADGASSAQKCIKFLATGPLPNLLWAGRDRAHAARISTSGPLLAEDTFKAWWDDVFNDRFALVPSIQNSEEWTARLALCQKVLLSSGVRGSEVGKNLDKVIKDLNFAKQRFDSTASPQLLYCALMVAIAMLLAYQASDERGCSAGRRRAARRLEEMPCHVLTAGLSAAFSDTAIRFVRLFDTSEHDPALTYRQKIDVVEMLQTLFLDGRIWDSVGDDPTPLSLAWNTAREAKPLYYGAEGKVVHLFRKPSPGHLQQLSDAVQAVTDSSIKRLHVEFSLDDVGVLFTAFDLVRWHAARCEMNEKQTADKLHILERHARHMFQAWRLDGSSGVQELRGMAFRLCAQEEERLKAGCPRDNRVLWESVLVGSCSGVLEPNDRVGTLLPMLEIYLSAADSTCGVERDLGTLSRILEAHKGPVDEDGSTISYCTELYLDGPHDETGIATRVDGVLLPTDFTRECVRLWISVHGRRFRVYKQGRPGHTKPRSKGSLAFLKQSVGQGLRKLCQKGKPSAEEETIVGLSRSAFVRPRGQENPAGAAKLLKKFDGLTNRKQAASLKLAMARRQSRTNGSNPYASVDLNPNRKLRLGKGLAGVRLPADGPPVRAAPGSRISTLTCCRALAPERDGYRVTALALRSSGVQLLTSIRGAGLVILDSPWALDHVPQLSELLLAVYLVVIAVGRAVVPRARWHECTSRGPPGSITVHFKKVFDSAERLLTMSAKFEREQPLLRSVLHEIAKLPASKWKVVQKLDGRQGTSFDSRLDVRNFLLSERRVRHQGCGLLGGAYFRPRSV